MKFNEYTMFQLSVALACQDGASGPKLRNRLSKAGFPDISASGNYSTKIKRCVTHKIIQVVRKPNGPEPAIYRTTERGKKECIKAFKMLVALSKGG